MPMLPALLILLALGQSDVPSFALRGAWFEGSDCLLRVEGAPDAPRVTTPDGEFEASPAEMPPASVFVVADASGSSARLLRASEQAALALLDGGARVGIVFAGSAPELALEPTGSREEVIGTFSRRSLGLGPGLAAITSAVGVALGAARGVPNASVVVLTDREDSAGPVDASLVWPVASSGGVPVFGYPVGNRSAVSLLEDLAAMSHGQCVPLLTPADVRASVAELGARLASERAFRIPWASAAPGPVVVEATATDGSDSLRLVGPPADPYATLLVEVARAGGEEERTLVLVRGEQGPVAWGLSGRPIRVASGVWNVDVGVAPTLRLSELTFDEGSVVAPEAVRLAGLALSGPDLGRPDGTRASLSTAEGVRVLELSCGETAWVRPGQWLARVETTPAWAPPEPFEAVEGEVRTIASPGLGWLRIDLVGADDRPLDAILPVRDLEGRVVMSLRTGRKVQAIAGRYSVSLPTPRERSVEVEVIEGAATVYALGDYGSLTIEALGTGERPLDLRVLVRDPEADGRLLTSGRTGRPIDLSAGIYDVEVLSTPSYTIHGLEVRPGLAARETVTRFGSLWASSESPGTMLALRDATGRWLGSYRLGEELVLPAGTYRVAPDPPGNPEQEVVVESRQLTRVILP